MTNGSVPEISVIIPAYCAADHLHVSVDSLLAQTYHDFEAIIVEDCSPDSGATLAEAHRLAGLDSRISVYRTDRNEGCGGARNVGMRHARGRYITFLDADDTLSPNAFSELIPLTEKYRADIVCWAMETIYPSGKVAGHVEGAREQVYTDRETIIEIALNQFSPSVGEGRTPYPVYTISMLIRRSMLEDNKIAFIDEPHFLSEDMPFCYAVMRHAYVYVFIPNTYYRYQLRPNSITHDPRADMIERAVKSAETFARLVENDPDVPEYGIKNVWGYVLTAVRSYVKLMFCSDRSLSFKRRWVRRQADIPLFRVIYERYPWRSMPFKHRLGFWAFYHKHFILLLTLVTGQEKLRKLLGKI